MTRTQPGQREAAVVAAAGSYPVAVLDLDQAWVGPPVGVVAARSARRTSTAPSSRAVRVHS